MTKTVCGVVSAILGNIEDLKEIIAAQTENIKDTDNTIKALEFTKSQDTKEKNRAGRIVKRLEKLVQ